MHWIPIICMVLVGLVAAVLLGSFGLFCYIFARGGRQAEFFCQQLARNPKNARLCQRMQQDLDWYQAQEPELWHIQSTDRTPLTAAFFSSPMAHRGTILLCHGWRSSGAADFCWIMREYLARGFDLLVLDQRGHGRSGGAWLGFGVLEAKDLQCWTEEVCRRQGANRPILLHGMSMGASTVQFALDLPLPDAVKGAVADCGFSSPQEELAFVLQNIHLPAWVLPLLNLWARLFAGYGLSDRSTIDVMRRNLRPVVWLHGQRDRRVPCHMSQAAYDAAICRKWLVTVPGAGHELSTLLDPDRCWDAIDAFIAYCLQDQA